MTASTPATVSIVSGRFRGTRLASPRSAKTHPMGSREKLALFNMLQPCLSQATVLDAYAGTGALGLEAISRGAGMVVFVEQSASTANLIRQNLAQLNLTFPVITATVAQFASRSGSRKAFDLVIADPPYDNFRPSEIAQLIDCLKPGGILALSCPATVSTPEFAGLHLISSRRYARAQIALYRAALQS